MEVAIRVEALETYISISLSVCIGLASKLLQIGARSTVLDVALMKGDGFVGASANLCMKAAICVKSLETLILHLAACACLVPPLLQAVESGTLFDIEWMRIGGVADASGQSCQVGHSELKRASWPSEVVSQNLIGSELFISF